MDVSIIVPVYNVAPYIKRCLGSIMCQSFDGSMECLLIDDCGTDASIAIAEKLINDYKGNIHFDILHHKHNRGLSASRNTGIENAKGDYIYFLDSDDYITEDCIKLLMKKARLDSSIELVQACFADITYDGKENVNITSNEVIRLNNNNDIRNAYFNTSLIHIQAWNKLIKRSFIVDNNILFKKGIIYEDYLWGFYMMKHMSDIILIPDVTYKKNSSRVDSITNGSKMFKRAEASWSIYKDFIQNLSPGHERKEYNFFARRFTLEYTKYVPYNTEFKVLMDIYKKMGKEYGTIATVLKLYGAQILGEFQKGEKIVYWCKKQKLKVDIFLHRAKIR